MIAAINKKASIARGKERVGGREKEIGREEQKGKREGRASAGS